MKTTSIRTTVFKRTIITIAVFALGNALWGSLCIASSIFQKKNCTIWDNVFFPQYILSDEYSSFSSQIAFPGLNKDKSQDYLYGGMREPSIGETFFAFQRKRFSSHYGFYFNLPKYSSEDNLGEDHNYASSSLSDAFAVWYSPAHEFIRGVSLETGFETEDDYDYSFHANDTLIDIDSSNEISTDKYGSLTLLARSPFPGAIRASVDIGMGNNERLHKRFRSVNDSVLWQYGGPLETSNINIEYELGYVLPNHGKSILTYAGGAIETERYKYSYSSIVNKGLLTRFDAFHSRQLKKDVFEIFYAIKGMYQAAFVWQDVLYENTDRSLFESISWNNSDIDISISAPLVFSVTPVNKFMAFISLEPIFAYSKSQGKNYQGEQETNKQSSITLGSRNFGIQLKPNSNMIIRLVPAFYAFPINSFEIYYHF